MDTAWKFDRLEEDQDTTPRPWYGSHAKPRASLRLTFADGGWHGLSYSDRTYARTIRRDGSFSC